MRTIGILGGSSDQATADYYRRLNAAVRRRLGGWHTAELLIDSLDFALAEHWVRNGLWDDAGRDLQRRARGLERAGAGLLICVSNTLHRLAGVFTDGLQIPFLHIAEPTAAAIRAAGLRNVALLGTKPVMATDFLKERYRRHGIVIVAPEAHEQDEIDRIIFDELCNGRFLPQSKARFLDIVDRLQARGATGVILGCTEIPLLIAQGDAPSMPMFDTVALHVEAAVAMAFSPTAAGSRGELECAES
jgi:aspartate racemase